MGFSTKLQSTCTPLLDILIFINCFYYGPWGHSIDCFPSCVFSYGTPLAQRASYLTLHSSLFGPDGTVTCNYDYIVTNSINSLLIGSKCIPNGAHTNHC